MCQVMQKKIWVSLEKGFLMLFLTFFVFVLLTYLLTYLLIAIEFAVPIGPAVLIFFLQRYFFCTYSGGRGDFVIYFLGTRDFHVS